jgi:hypothetical protein
MAVKGENGKCEIGVQSKLLIITQRRKGAKEEKKK